MIGVFVNGAAIIVGSIIGLLINKGLKENYEKIMINGVAISVLFIGITGTVNGLSNKDSNSILFIISLVIGGIIGEWLNIEGRLESLGNWLEKKMPKSNKSFSKGFVSASLIFCVGTMGILGAINSGAKHDNTILFAKAMLDGTAAIIFASTLGFGVVFSAFSVVMYEGAIALFASCIQGYLTDDMMLEISIVGGIMITMLALNMLGLTKIKVGNYLPAILIPVIYLLVRV